MSVKFMACVMVVVLQIIAMVTAIYVGKMMAVNDDESGKAALGVYLFMQGFVLWGAWSIGRVSAKENP